jgi:hypothetical protein
MCPFCLASIGLIVASATSAGGLAALAVKLSQKKNPGQEVAANSSESSTIGQDRRVGPAGIASDSRRQLIRHRHTSVPNCAYHACTGKVGQCRAEKEKRERPILKDIPS